MKALIVFVVVLVIFVVVSGEDKGNQVSQTAETNSASSDYPPSSHNLPPACDKTTTRTGRVRTLDADSVNVRSGPGTDYPKLVNKKASAALKGTHYITVDSSTVLFEECTKDGWSWIRVTEPDWLRESHRGWISSQFFSTVEDDSVKSKIAKAALAPYTKESYPKTIKQFGSRLEEIEQFRATLAEKAIESGKCDYVYMSELSNNRSTLNKLVFWVDCRNGERIYMTEEQLKAGDSAMTEKERAWDKTEATRACRQGIIDRALLPSKVDIHTILGTSVSESDITHNVVVSMDFDAMNAMGVELPYTAKCYFEPGRLGNIELYRR